jgi:hypothetical protein
MKSILESSESLQGLVHISYGSQCGFEDNDARAATVLDLHSLFKSSVKVLTINAMKTSPRLIAVKTCSTIEPFLSSSEGARAQYPLGRKTSVRRTALSRRKELSKKRGRYVKSADWRSPFITTRSKICLGHTALLCLR